jgi:predicted ArsR family transcriptional regulator
MTGRGRTSASPTRRSIVELLERSLSGMTAGELADALGVRPNAIRKHLRALVGDGTVGARREATGHRGRPAVRYRAAGPRREAVATARLARMLVELVAEIGPDEARIEEFGRRQAALLAVSGDGRAALLDLLTALGFSPRETTGAAGARSGRLELVLGHCPFRDAVAAEGGRLVCVLHRGISRGLIERSPDARLTGFEARPPEVAGCRIAAAGLGPGGPGSGAA